MRVRSWRLYLFALPFIALAASACAGGGPRNDGTGGDGVTADDVTVQTGGTDSNDGGALPALQEFYWLDGSQPPTSINLDEIRAGGPPPDGIPPIDEPTYVTVAEADEWLEPTEPVMVVQRGTQVRAYPIRIMTYHEIVNDVLDGLPTLVTYCPLCNSGLAFDPTVRGETLDFGTSGRLWQSNLVMYDRQTQSLWSQFTGEAIVGGLLGQELQRLPIGLVSWADYKAAHPDGDVLSQETGFTRPYGTNPYTGYDNPNGTPFLFDGDTSDVLPQMTRVVTVGEDADPAAFTLDALMADRVIAADVDGRPVVALWTAGVNSALDSSQISQGQDVGAAGVFSPIIAGGDGQALTFRPADETTFVDDQTGSSWNILGQSTSGPHEGAILDRIAHDDTFWFVQYAFRPETRIIS